VHEVRLGDFVLRYEQESSRRVGRTVFEYVFRGSLESPGGPATARRAVVRSADPATEIVDDRLEFPGIGEAAAPVTSLDTFSVRHDRRSPFDPARLLFELDPPNRGLVSSEPANGASDVPVTAWLRLAFGSPVDDALLASLLLRCGGVSLPFSAGAVAPGVLAVNPDGDLPPQSACVLDFASPAGSRALLFETAALDADLPSVVYDRTNLGLTAPHPDDVWTEPDAETATGLHLAIPALDREPDVVDVFEALRAAAPSFDGFSPLGGITIQLGAAPDPASVPASDAGSLDPLASIGLYDVSPESPDFGTRVPFSATVGADSVLGRPPDHGIVLFPGIPLRSGGRYGLVVTRRLLASPSRPFAASAFSEAALGPPETGEPGAVTRARELSGEVLTALAATQAVPFAADDVALVLRVTVRTTDDIDDDVLSMKQQVLARPPPAFEILSVRAGTDTAAAVVTGEWDAPEWRRGKFLARTAAGLPRIVTTRRIPFTLALPREARSGPVPLVLYQHGSPGSAENEVPRNHLTKAGFAVAGFTDPLNRENDSNPDQFVLAIFGNLLFGQRAAEYEAQTYGEQLAFLRMLPGLGSIDVLLLGAPDGIPDIDGGAPLGYLGISQGAVHGEAFLAYAPEITAATLVVGGNRITENYYHQARESPIGATPLLQALVGLIQNATPTDVWVGAALGRAAARARAAAREPRPAHHQRLRAVRARGQPAGPAGLAGLRDPARGTLLRAERAGLALPAGRLPAQRAGRAGADHRRPLRGPERRRRERRRGVSPGRRAPDPAGRAMSRVPDRRRPTGP
jgi:hypothetical protein